MKRLIMVVLSLFMVSPRLAFSQTLDSPGAVKAAITAKYHVTQATADYTDIVTAGDVVTLRKSGLVMYGTTTGVARTGNVSYHDGKLNSGGMTKFMTLNSVTNSSSSVPTRTFVSGEKCWLLEVSVKTDGLYLLFMSDPINDVRYMGSIKFPVDKKQPMPGPEVMMPLVAEVISAEPLPSQSQQPASQNAVAAAPVAPPPPIAPPPPPADEPIAPPPTISLGQTKDQVQASFGQPVRVVKLGTKEIEYFKDMKVTFVNGKVTDVQ